MVDREPGGTKTQNSRIAVCRSAARLACAMLCENPQKADSRSSESSAYTTKQTDAGASVCFVAGALRLELRRTVLETAMLPLHHAPIMSTNGIIALRVFVVKHYFIAPRP